MVEVLLTPQAQADLVRLEAFLWECQDPLALQLLDFLFDGLHVLTHQPGIGRPLAHGHRELIISRGRGGYLARYVFDFAWTASLWVPLAGALAGAVLALLAGWWGLRDVLRRPVVETLRRAAE